ncbi:hypothetical protein ACH4E7_06735 [Kitasatospora sp. NPDC018058]|uniref:hypothetical protein n=1 Tax=Kitasatospora sp. NPDC018058 TaxID=3364025 RepID=UPI0037C0640F
MTVDMTMLVEYRPPGGEPRQIRVTGEQLHGRACVVGPGCTGEVLVDAGHVRTSTGEGSAPLGWPVVAHRACVEMEAQ